MTEDKLIVSVSGIRGNAGSALTPQAAFEFGAAFGTMLGKDAKVAIGMDSRPSGMMIKNSIASGLLACGVDVITLGIVSTPGAALMTRMMECDGGVVVTASHNPLPQNGIKFLQPTGTAQTAENMNRLKEIRNAGDFNFQSGPDIGQETVNNRTHPTHIDAVLALTDVTGVSSRRFRVALDSINGAGCVGASMLLSKLGCEVIQINGEPTGQFAHTPEPIKENLTDLCEAVKKHRADIGFALDPDADRLVVIDEIGSYPGEEYTLALAASFVLSHRKGKLATNLSTSRMIDDIAAANGVEVLRSPTGEANVAGLMAAEGCIFGGEGNGGVIEPRIVPVRDSFIGMAMILQYMYERQERIFSLIDEIPSYEMIKVKVPLPPAGGAAAIEAVKNAFAGRDGVKIDESDGIRIDLPDRWVLLRESNTEPIMRIFAESPDAESSQQLIDEAKEAAGIE